MENAIGYHIIIDGFFSKKSFESIDKIYDFLIDSVSEVNMTIIMPPVIAKFPYNTDLLLKVYNDYAENNLEDTALYKDIKKYIVETNNQLSGFSGTQILMESHLAIHTFPEMKIKDISDSIFVSLDLYSCKEYSFEQYINYLKEKHGFIEGNILEIKRYDCRMETRNYRVEKGS